MNKRLFILLACLSMSVSMLSAQGSFPLPAGEPPAADPDKCYAICLVPNQYETVVQQVETRAAETRTIVALPTYETMRSQVMIKPASAKLTAVPAQYETLTETITLQPEYKRYVYTEAEWEEYEDRVMIEEGSTTYQTSNARFASVTNSNLYYGDPNGGSKDYGNLLDPNNPYHPDKPDSPFNPRNPNGIYNPENPNSPYNPVSPYSTDNSNNLLDPDNPNSPFNPTYVEKNGVEAATKAANEALMSAGAGTILPYLINEARVDIERIRREYDTVTEEVEVQAAYITYVKGTAPCTDGKGDCISWCPVQMPAEMQTVTRRVPKACATGYTPGTVETGGEDYCIRLKYIPAEYGARSIMTAEAAMTEKAIAPRYRTVKKKRLVKEASMEEIIVPAVTETVTKQVVKRAAYTLKQIIPAAYKSITRQVRRGLGDAGFYTNGGVLMLPTEYGTTGVAPGTFPTTLNPATGYTLPQQTVKGDLGEGPDRNGTLTGGQTGMVNLDRGRIPGGLPENYYTAGCPDGYRYDPLDNTCKKTEEVPAQYETVSVRKLAERSGFSEWQEVLCPNKLDAVTIRAVQRALNTRGYDAGVADNVMGARTKSALNKFQRENNLPIGGLNMATLRALGLR